MESLQLADKVIVCGETMSHCVNYTVRDLVAAWPKDRRQDLVILTDCASPVPGFEKAGEVLKWAFSYNSASLAGLAQSKLILLLSY